MSANNEQSLIGKFTSAVKNLLANLSPETARALSDSNQAWDNAVMAERKPKLFLVLANTQPGDDSNDWEKDNLLTQIEALEGQKTMTGIVAENCTVTVRALHRHINAGKAQDFTSVGAGQWIECSGRYGGPLGDMFFPNAIRVRDDLPCVAPDELPQTGTTANLVSIALQGPPETAAFHFKI